MIENTVYPYLHLRTDCTDWAQTGKRLGVAWEGIKARFKATAIRGVNGYIFGARKVYEDWYDHPYTMIERWDDEEDEQRVYAGGNCNTAHSTIDTTS